MTARCPIDRVRAVRVIALFVLALLLGAIAGGLLFPSPASAVVDRKHARVYRAYVKAIATGIANDQEAFNGFAEDLAEIALDIEAVLNNPPVDHEALLALEEQAKWLVDQIPTARIMPKDLRGMAETLRKDGPPWFHSRADKRTLRRGTNRIIAGANLILVAYSHLGEAAGELAKDPPDLAKAREYNKQCADAVALANPKFKRGMEMLRSLRR